MNGEALSFKGLSVKEEAPRGSSQTPPLEQDWTVEHLNGRWRLMEDDEEIFSHVHVEQEALKKIAERHNAPKPETGNRIPDSKEAAA